MIGVPLYDRAVNTVLQDYALFPLSMVPVYLAHRLTRKEGGAAATRGGAVEAEATAVP